MSLIEQAKVELAAVNFGEDDSRVNALHAQRARPAKRETTCRPASPANAASSAASRPSPASRTASRPSSSAKLP